MSDKAMDLRQEEALRELKAWQRMGKREPRGADGAAGEVVPEGANAISLNHTTPGPQSKPNPLLEAALGYAGRGWAVLPLKPRDKKPLTPHGVKDATTAPERIQQWWARWPDANVGIACGPSGLVVLDVDPRDGGHVSLEGLEAQHGRLPKTVESLTGGGGRHIFFRWPGGMRCGRPADGLDVKANGGYIVAPPSVHPSGGPYEWREGHAPDEVPLAEPPQWLVGQPKPSCVPDVIPEGTRNVELTRLAGKMRRVGLDEEAIFSELKRLNAKCDPPLEERELRSIAASVSKYSPGYALTDGGNAEFFADQYAERVCFRHDRRQWLVWRGPIWRPDEDGEIPRLALEAVRLRQLQAWNIEDVEQRRKALMWLLQSENAHRLRSMVEIARSNEQLAKSGQEFDTRPDLLAVRNGVIDLRTGTFRQGRPEDYLTQRAGTEYDPDAKAPRWERFVNEIFQNDQDLVEFVKRLVGYTLTGSTREQVFVFCYGTGRNGKSTLFEILRNLLGDYAKNAAFTTFTRERGKNGHEDDLMALEGARLVTAVESKAVTQLAEDTLKIIAGMDPITGSRKSEKTRTYVPAFKVWLAANNLPTVKDVTEGFWRKVVLLTFGARFEGDLEDKRLTDKLRAELPGILNWALEGCLEWQRRGLDPPKRCIDAATAWRLDNDPVGEFLRACPKSPGAEVQVSILYQDYVRLCEQWGQRPVAIKPFSQLVEAHGFRREKRRDGRYFIGIGRPP